MPKLIAPCGASWRGRALAAGDVIDVSDAEAASLAAHGFRKPEPCPKEQDFTGTADILSATVPMERPNADGTSAVPVESSGLERSQSVSDTAKLARKDLLKLLKGRGLGNLFVKPTEELRALAAITLAGEKLAEADHDRK